MGWKCDTKAMFGSRRRPSVARPRSETLTLYSKLFKVLASALLTKYLYFSLFVDSTY